VIPAVPRYFFHVLDGDWYLDQEGDDLPDLRSAIREAERVARDLLQDEAKGDMSHARLDVADEHGTIVHVVRFREQARKSDDGPLGGYG
jgi:hypothetical protein